MDDMPDMPDTLRQLFDDLAAQAGAETGDSGGGCEYLRQGRAFAAIEGDAAEIRLDPEIADAVKRTPATGPSSRGPDWVRFTPPELDRHALDRAEAWFLSAWRAADATRPRSG
jgi:hypothetical protein